MKKGIFLVSMVMLVATGCTKSEKREVVEHTRYESGKHPMVVNTTKAAKKVSETEENFVVERDQNLEISLGFTPPTMVGDDWNTYFEIYQDAKLQHPVKECWFDYEENTKKLTIQPPCFGTAELTSIGIYNAELNRVSGKHVYDDVMGDNWGNLDHFYFVQKVNVSTGKQLEKPIVHTMKVKSEIESAPAVVYSVNGRGEALLQWEEVPGAKEYLVFTVDVTEEGIGTLAYVCGRTKKTSWTTASTQYGSEVDEMNKEFCSFTESEDDIAAGERTPNREIQPDASVGVIAITDHGASPISELYSLKEYMKKLPNRLADHANEEKEIDKSEQQSIADLPKEAYVTMCDGKTVSRALVYDVENAHMSEYGESGHVEIMADVAGTKFQMEYRVEFDDRVMAQQELAKLQSQQEEKQENFQAESGVTATTPLSEHIAKCLLKNETNIDISGFSESRSKDKVEDALMEAQCQNPLIMEIDHMVYNTVTQIIHITYVESEEQGKKKRQEVQKKSKEIVGKIIKKGMTELEKEIAINEFLCGNTTYDKAAANSSKASGYSKIEKKYRDSFTAYGALVKKTAVCEGYANAFKVLADEAGLPCIIVTGRLNGKEPHAWNRVRVDGKWRTIDSTNNDGETIKNALFNLSDQAIKNVLVQDKAFLVDKQIKNYCCDDDKQEYYHTQGSYVSKDKVEKELVRRLKRKKDVALRTDYSMSDKEYKKIEIGRAHV